MKGQSGDRFSTIETYARANEKTIMFSPHCDIVKTTTQPQLNQTKQNNQQINESWV